MYFHRDIPFSDFVIPDTPAAGQLCTYIPPAQEIWLVQSVSYTIVTSGVAGNRLPWLRLYNSGAALNVYQWEDATAITASKTVAITWTIGAQRNSPASGAYLTFPLPTDCVNNVQTKIEFGAHAMDAGDQLSNLFITYCSWKV